MSDDPRPVYEAARHAHTPAIAQNRSNVDTIIDARRYRHWQQNSQTTKAFKAGNRPASFASARPVPPRTVRLALLADGVTACMPGAVLAPAPTPEVAEVGKAPVFVDDSGARKRLLRIAGVLISLLSVGFLTVLGVALAVPPVTTSVGLGGVVPFIVPGAAAPPPTKAPPARSHPTPRHSSHRLRSPESLRSSDRWTDPPVRPGACGRREPGRLTRPPGIRGRGGTDRGSHLLSRLRIRNLGVAPTSARAIRAPDRPQPSSMIFQTVEAATVRPHRRPRRAPTGPGVRGLPHDGRTSGSVGQAAGHRLARPSRRAPMSTACRVGDLSMRVTMIGWWEDGRRWGTPSGGAWAGPRRETDARSACRGRGGGGDGDRTGR